MGKEIDGMEIVNRVKDVWMKDPGKYLLPALEYMLITMIFSVLISTILTPFFLIPVIPVYFIVEYQAYWMIILVVVFFIIFFIFIFGISIFFNGIMIGGTSVVSRRMWKGKDYKFFDIWKYGWKGRRKFIPIAGATLFSQIGIMMIVRSILSLLVLPFYLLMLIDPILILIPIVMSLLVWILLIPVSVFFFTYPYLTFTYHRRYRTGSWDTIKGTLRFMRKNKRLVMLYGALFYLFQICASFIPTLGILIISAGTIYLHQCLDLSLDKR